MTQAGKKLFHSSLLERDKNFRLDFSLGVKKLFRAAAANFMFSFVLRVCH